MFFIAFRQMTARKMQTFLTLLGIVFGSMGYIVISGVMLGFREYLLEQLVNNDAHVKVSPRLEIITREGTEKLLFDPKENISWISEPAGRKDNSEIRSASHWYNILSNDPDVEAFSRQLASKVIISKGSLTDAGSVIGVEPLKHSRVTNIRDNMLYGKFTDLGDSGNKLIMGEGLREQVGIRINESVYLSAGPGKSMPFKVIGSFRTGNKAIDDNVCYASLNDVQTLNRTPGKISSISIRLKDVSLAQEKAAYYLSTNPDRVESWDQANASFLTIFKLQDTIRYAITVIILVVSGFGIYNILNILINQKKREIAILRSIGYEAGDILIIFLIQGVVLGIIGGIAGMMLGWIICDRLTLIRFSNPYFSTKTGYMLISFNYRIYMQSFVLAFLATVFASILPARKAGKMQPIEIIRGEV